MPVKLVSHVAVRVNRHVSERAITKYYNAHPRYFMHDELRGLPGFTSATRREADRGAEPSSEVAPGRPSFGGTATLT